MGFEGIGVLVSGVQTKRGRSTLSGSALFDPDDHERATLLSLQADVDDGRDREMGVADDRFKRAGGRISKTAILRSNVRCVSA